MLGKPHGPRRRRRKPRLNVFLANRVWARLWKRFLHFIPNPLTLLRTLSGPYQGMKELDPEQEKVALHWLLDSLYPQLLTEGEDGRLFQRFLEAQGDDLSDQEEEVADWLLQSEVKLFVIHSVLKGQGFYGIDLFDTDNQESQFIASSEDAGAISGMIGLCAVHPWASSGMKALEPPFLLPGILAEPFAAKLRAAEQELTEELGRPARTGEAIAWARLLANDRLADLYRMWVLQAPTASFYFPDSDRFYSHFTGLKELPDFVTVGRQLEYEVFLQAWLSAGTSAELAPEGLTRWQLPVVRLFDEADPRLERVIGWLCMARDVVHLRVADPAWADEATDLLVDLFGELAVQVEPEDLIGLPNTGWLRPGEEPEELQPEQIEVPLLGPHGRSLDEDDEEEE